MKNGTGPILPPPRLKDSTELESSPVAANCRMNRERQLSGVNSYDRELGFEVATFLRSRLQETGRAAWLDLCCGTGTALIQAARLFTRESSRPQCSITGVDLVNAFAPVPPDASGLELIEASLPDWNPPHRYDLITCVHGLHYLGDKLQVLALAAGWLASDGTFAAQIDLNNIRLEGALQSNRQLLKTLRACGFSWNSRRHLVSRTGCGSVQFPCLFLGADDQAGPNYTGQPAVTSWYRCQPGPLQSTARAEPPTAVRARWCRGEK